MSDHYFMLEHANKSHIGLFVLKDTVTCKQSHNHLLIELAGLSLRHAQNITSAAYKVIGG